MNHIKKATVGIVLSERIFRLSTQAGALTDDLLALRGKKIDLDSFESVLWEPRSNTLRLFNDEAGIYLLANLEGITFTYDLYNLEEATFQFDDFIAKFQSIWDVFNARIKASAIRRIGFVTEQRFEAGKNSSKLLVEKLTTIQSDGFPAKFNLSFEDRKNVGVGGLPDPTKDDFINIIRSYYDSLLDKEHPEDDCINANLDVQRYYNPALKGSPFDGIKKLKIEYDKAALKFAIDIKKLGINNGKAA